MNYHTVITATEDENKKYMKRNLLLLAGGYISLVFAAFQISGIFLPPVAIRYFGGPVALSETRPAVFMLLCITIAAITAIFGIYALSGAGQIRRLPLLYTVITTATAIYMLRGLLLIPQIPVVFKHTSFLRFALFSAISLCVGLIHLGGLLKLFKHRRNVILQ